MKVYGSAKTLLMGAHVSTLNNALQMVPHIVERYG